VVEGPCEMIGRKMRLIGQCGTKHEYAGGRRWRGHDVIDVDESSSSLIVAVVLAVAV
jgi:hypothetical protein